MELIGRFLSPFVRRTATTLNALGLAFESKALATTEPDLLKSNPLARVPALVTDDGDNLIDSWAIIDYALEIGNNSDALLPLKGQARRDVMKLSAIAVGAMEKTVASAYERNKRPKEKVHQEWLDQVESQALAGLKELDAAAKDRQYLCGNGLTLADINAVVAYDFAKIVMPYKFAEEDPPFPWLAALSERCNATEIFASTQFKG